MSSSNDAGERKPVHKVTISSISPEILAVKIRQISTEENIPESPSAIEPTSRSSGIQEEYSKANKKTDKKNLLTVPSKSSRKGNKSGSSNKRSNSDKRSRSTMTDRAHTSAGSPQTVRREEKTCNSVDSSSSSPPCIKHAAQNISRKAESLPAEKIKLCDGCSKSMLSYIFLVQDFLDSLAKEISGEGTSHCLQCARQEVRDSVASLGDDYSPKKVVSSKEENVSKSHPECEQSRIDSKSKDESSSRMSSKRTSRTRSNRQESKRNEIIYGGASSPEIFPNRQQVDFVYNISPPNTARQEKNFSLPSNDDREIHIVDSSNSENQTTIHQQPTSSSQNLNQQVISNQSNSNQQTDFPQSSKQQNAEMHNQNYNPQQTASDHYEKSGTQDYVSSQSSPSKTESSSDGKYYSPSQQNEEPSAKPIFRAPMERIQPNYDMPANPDGGNQHDQNANFPSQQQSPSLFRDNVDGIVSALSNAEREIYDTARNGAGWETLTEPPERLGSSSSNIISSEAYVTSCRNNAEAIGCIVVGTSLLLSRTSRTLCVLMSDGVSAAFRGALSAVFHVVQNVRSLDSLGTTKLALLEQPELGITFEKLNVWRLTQFSKCVYLNPDTLVIQNCDELFCHEELSAVPDIGWPDCFNSGVFVFAPSVHTFWQLMDFAEKQGSYDGGDQGLLNSYFNSWSSDLSRKLSFIYNLMANVSYTYTPAFKQFGRNVKIVQFHGSFKPWHVKFFTKTGQVSPSSPVHPTYVQFVHIWLNIFRISGLRLMSQEIQSYAASQETICAVEILRFFPLPTESEAEFFLTPPSVRLRLAEKKLSRTTSSPISEARRRKSAEFPRYTEPEDESIAEKASTTTHEESKATSTSQPEETQAGTADTSKSAQGESTEDSKDNKSEESTLEMEDEVFKDKVATKVKDKNALPGAEVGDYQGMKAWEQGRIDYEGTDSSDNVIKRLQFLMSRPK